MTQELALFAGSAAAAIFVISQLPMLIKARPRGFSPTRDTPVGRTR
jgi:hypothetical protein